MHFIVSFIEREKILTIFIKRGFNNKHFLLNTKIVKIYL